MPVYLSLLRGEAHKANGSVLSRPCPDGGAGREADIARETVI